MSLISLGHGPLRRVRVKSGALRGSTQCTDARRTADVQVNKWPRFQRDEIDGECCPWRKRPNRSGVYASCLFTSTECTASTDMYKRAYV